MRVQIIGHASYVYLDIASFTRGRSIEAQQDIIGVLNETIKDSIGAMQNPLPKDQVLYLSTGDGVCIALLSVQARFDLHLHTALDILMRIEKHNQDTTDQMRNFQVRIGLNSNVDNFIKDINDNRNVAGAGINYAQRLMGLADPGQIMVSDIDYEILRQREKYMKAFRGYSTEVKHGQSIRAYQYIGENHEGLDTGVPTRFRKPAEKRRRLSKLEAYYIAHALTNRAYFGSVRLADSGDFFAATVLLWNLATESLELTKSADHESTSSRVTNDDRTSKTIPERLAHYGEQDYWVCCDLANLLVETKLSFIRQYFDDEFPNTANFASASGAQKLKIDWPDIWTEFGLEGCIPNKNKADVDQ